MIEAEGYYLPHIRESRFRESFAFGIQKLGKYLFWNLNPRLWNPEYSSRNPESHQLLETGIQYLKSGIQGVESSIPVNRGDFYATLHPNVIVFFCLLVTIQNYNKYSMC